MQCHTPGCCGRSDRAILITLLWWLAKKTAARGVFTTKYHYTAFSAIKQSILKKKHYIIHRPAKYADIFVLFFTLQAKKCPIQVSLNIKEDTQFMNFLMDFSGKML